MTLGKTNLLKKEMFLEMKTKKILSLVLCLLMLFSIVPLSASADTEPADYVKTDFRFEAGQPVPTKRSQYTVGTGYIGSEGVEIILSAYTTGLDYMRDGVYLNNGGKFTEQNSGTFLKNTGYELKVSFTCRSKIETDLVLIAGGETYSPYLYQFREDRIWIDGHKENVWDICYFYYILLKVFCHFIGLASEEEREEQGKSNSCRNTAPYR